MNKRGLQLNPQPIQHHQNLSSIEIEEKNQPQQKQPQLIRSPNPAMWKDVKVWHPANWKTIQQDGKGQEQ